MSASPGSLLLVGPGGFVGPWLARAALAEGWQVTGLSRHPHLVGLPGDAGYTPVVGDANDAASCARWLDAVDAVIFNAAYLPNDYAAASEAGACIRTNALAPLGLLTLLTARPRPFVYISTAQGYQDTGGKVEESDPVFPSRHAAYYLASKLLGDIYADHFRITHHVPTTVLRLGSLYGPGLRRGMIGRFVECAIGRLPITLQNGGRHRADLTFVGDAAQAAMRALARSATGIYNIGSGEATSALEAARMVLREVGQPEISLEIQAPVLNAPAGGSAALNVSRAMHDLGFVPTTAAAGLRRTVAEWPPATRTV